MTQPIRRKAVRALILATDTDRVLLMRMEVPDSGKLIWLTPGGGIEKNETALDAVRREVFEETGLQMLPEHKLTPSPIWKRRMTFELYERLYDQSEEIYLLETTTFTPSSEHNPALEESATFRGFKWWSHAEIAKSNDLFVPLAMAQHLTNLLTNGIPNHTIDVGT